MKKLIALCGLALVLAACADQPSTTVQTSQSLPPKIMLNAQTITLTDRTGMQPAGSPYANNHFSPTISEAIKQWASDRLQATGGVGSVIIVVKDASLTSQPLQLQSGIDTWFTRQQASKYVAHAEVSVEANGANQSYATADAVATRSVTLPENPTDVERQEAYYTLLNGLMKDLGQNLEASIQAHMGTFIDGQNTSSLLGNSGMTDLQPGLAPQSSDVTASPRMAQNSSLTGIAHEQMEAPQAAVYGVSTIPALPDVPAPTVVTTGALADSALQPQAAFASASAAGPVTIPLSGSYTR